MTKIKAIMKSQFQIESLNYDLIHRAVNLTAQDRNVLLGYARKNMFIAVRLTPQGLEVLPNTLGKRDSCAASLQQYHTAV